MRVRIAPIFSREINWLLASAARFMRLHALTLTFIVVSSALSLLDPLLLKLMIDRALPQRSLYLCGVAAGLFCAAFIGRLIFSSAAIWSSTLAAQKLIFRTRVSVLRRLNALPAKYHDASAVGDNLYRLDQDIARIGELGADVIPAAVQMLFTGLMVFVTMVLLDKRLTLLICPLLVIFYVTQKGYYQKLRSISEHAQEHAGALNSLLEEHLNGILQLKLLNRANTRTRAIARAMAGVAAANTRQRIFEIRFSLGSMAVIAAGNTVILGYGGYQVISGQLTAGTLVAFYGYLLRLFEPLVIATDLQARGQRVGASVKRILELFERAPRRTAALGRFTLPGPPSALEFHNVSFSYRDDRLILSKVNFRIREGEQVALVGVNGSGKSTIGQIASGLYRPDQGSVLVNGADLETLNWGKLCRSISLVPQDPVVFSGTIRENILYGNPHASDTEIDAAAKIVRFDEVLQRFPLGMDEILGPKGKRLSGGERKRLALTRAMLQNPQILILDEVTAALDEPTAEALLSNLDGVCKGRRVLVLISHRPATIRWASRILVVEGGTIIDDGPHDELIQRCPRYRQIYLGALHSQPGSGQAMCS